MQDLLDQAGETKFPDYGDTIQGTVVAITKNGIWVDLDMYGTGVIMGPELMDPRVKESIKIGEAIGASVIEQEFEDGTVLLSLGKATRERSWNRIEELVENGESIMVIPQGANKGGLLVEVEGVKGFLPVSQLSSKNYPRVQDKEEILSRLNSFVGKPMEVAVMDASRKENKLILSEKLVKKGEVSEVLSKYKSGDKVKCRVTGIVDFGIFVSVENLEGLIHISEISWEKVDNPSNYAKVGDEIEAVILEIEADRLSLSIKRLTDDPWLKEVKGIKVGSKVKGEVTRVTPFGAFVKLNDKIEALVHISELSHDHIKSPEEVVEVGKTYEFKVLTLDVESHRLALSLKGDKPKEKDNEK